MKMRLRFFALLLLLGAWLHSAIARAACEPDRVQASGAIYRICMPPADQYNGRLVVWAHGFQDSGTPISIPEDQLKISGITLPSLVNDLGFGFATTSYAKTGLAVHQGMADILDLVEIFRAGQGAPKKVYLTGASEGGLITALLAETHPEAFSGALAVCGPVGDFAYQMQYLGDARATFQYYFPDLIPGDPFRPAAKLANTWSDYYAATVRPALLSRANRKNFKAWVKAANLPFDPRKAVPTQEDTARQVLDYAVKELEDTRETLGGLPYGNLDRQYRDAALNQGVTRVAADSAALAEIQTHYETTGRPGVPLLTLHTTRDPQVPYRHERLYLAKTKASGAYPKTHFNIRIPRYGHCQFKSAEIMAAFGALLLYAQDPEPLAELPASVRRDLRLAARKYRLPF